MIRCPLHGIEMRYEFRENWYACHCAVRVFAENGHPYVPYECRDGTRTWWPLVGPKQTSRRVRAAVAAERSALLDHGVRFLLEDGWRNPWSTDPLRPSYRGKSYPIGKQAHAYALRSTRAHFAAACACLPAFHDLTRWKVENEMQAAARVCERRLRAARKPLAVIEPQSSLPGLQRTVAELEKRCYLPIEEICGCFRQGPRSAEQRDTRVVVDEAIRAMVKHHRMIHPVLEDKERYGLRQWQQARSEWREFVGASLQAHNNRLILFDTYGGDVDDESGTPPAGFFFDDEADSHGNRLGGRRAPRTRRKPQIVVRIAEALSVDQSTVKRVLGQNEPTYRRRLEEAS